MLSSGVHSQTMMVNIGRIFVRPFFFPWLLYGKDWVHRSDGMADGKSVTHNRAEREAIIEFHAIGHTVKVSAIDAATLTEVSIVAPASATEREMTDAVVRKLRYVLARRKGA